MNYNNCERFNLHYFALIGSAQPAFDILIIIIKKFKFYKYDWITHNKYAEFKNSIMNEVQNNNIINFGNLLAIIRSFNIKIYSIAFTFKIILVI